MLGLMAFAFGGQVMSQDLIQGLSKSDDPVSISADNGIEWDQEAKIYSARGNVQASQGDFFVSSDELKAFYTEVTDGNPDVHTIDAIGNIYASFGTNELVGDRLEYKVKTEFATVTGKEILLQSEQGNLSATEKLIYSGLELRAEAFGSPQISQGTNIVSADHIVAFFLPSDAVQGGTGRLRQVEAVGEVFVTNGTAVCRGNKAAYDVINETAVLSGNVSCTHCTNQLVGDYAKVDLKSGQARIESREHKNAIERTYIIINPNTPSEGAC